MANHNMPSDLQSIKQDAKVFPAGILPPGKNFDSYIGQNVINISDTELSADQVSALEKGLTFSPTPGSPDK